MAILIYPDGKTKEVKPKNPRKGFQLEELYSMLECEMVEMAYPAYPSLELAKTKEYLIVDEEGWLKENALDKYNQKASSLVGQDITGIALRCKPGDFK